MTSQRQIARLIAPTMLARYHMVDMKQGKRRLRLVELTIFTAMACSLPDQPAYRSIH